MRVAASCRAADGEDLREVRPSWEVLDREDPIDLLEVLVEVLEPFVAANAASDLAIQ